MDIATHLKAQILGECVPITRMLDPITAWSSWALNLRASYSREDLDRSVRAGLETLISDLAQRALKDGYSGDVVLKDPDFCLHLEGLDRLTRHLDRKVVGIVRDPLDAVASFATVASAVDQPLTLLAAGRRLWPHFAGIADLFDGTVFSDAKLLRLEDLPSNPHLVHRILKIKDSVDQRAKASFGLLSHDQFFSRQNLQPFVSPKVAVEYPSYCASEYEELTCMYSGLRQRLGYI